MRIQGRINTCACPFPPPLGSWSMCWLGDFGLSLCKAHSWSHMQLAHGTCPPRPSGLTPKRLYEFIDAGSRMAKDPCRKEGKLKVFWHLKRLSGKFLMMAMTQGGSLQIFSSSHGSSRRNLRTVTYLVALEVLRDMLANKLILSWQNIIGAHKKKRWRESDGDWGGK